MQVRRIHVDSDRGDTSRGQRTNSLAQYGAARAIALEDEVDVIASGCRSGLSLTEQSTGPEDVRVKICTPPGIDRPSGRCHMVCVSGPVIT